MSPCSRCGAPLPEGALVCGACHRLVHAEELAELAARARAQEEQHDLSGALASWRQALDRLPAATRQAEQVAARVQELSARIDEPAAASAPAEPGPATSRKGLAATVVTALALLWKGKFLVVAALTKGKVLLLGLTKLPTLLSMFVAVGAYAMLFGWRFALGFVLSIYVHEMGHVVALRRYGIAATAPMFVPGLGAFVRLRQYPATPREDAAVGLAGPLWGLGAAVACGGWWLATGSPLAAALAHTGAWLNLFNLLPVWQLDGGRGFRAMDRGQRWLAVLAIAAGWAIAEDTVLFLVGLAAVGRTLVDPPAEAGDRRAFLTYVGLVLALAALLAAIPDPALAS